MSLTIPKKYLTYRRDSTDICWMCEENINSYLATEGCKQDDYEESCENIALNWMWGARVLSVLIMIIRFRVKGDDEHTDYLL